MLAVALANACGGAPSAAIEPHGVSSAAEHPHGETHAAVDRHDDTPAAVDQHGAAVAPAPVSQPSHAPGCQTLTFMHQPARHFGGMKVPPMCRDRQGRAGFDSDGKCDVPDQEDIEICNLCRTDADCTARGDGRCIGVRVNGPTKWGGYPQCVYPDNPGHPSHRPPCPAPGDATPVRTQYDVASWRTECIAPGPGAPCRWGTCTLEHNRALP